MFPFATYTFLKHDFVVQRRIYALNYIILFFNFWFCFEKSENLFSLTVFKKNGVNKWLA